jgi:FkbM family methyltransferase
MQKDLIFDIGCNNGDDTDFYLRKGFRVLALDADRKMCDQVSKRFERELSTGQLSVIHGLITSEQSEFAPFYLCNELPDRSTADCYFARTNMAAGFPTTEIRVPVVRMTDVFREYGIPYYVKIDIEGMDIVPLEAISSLTSEKPKYVSVEVAHHDLLVAIKQLSTLLQCGYSNFLFFNQVLRRHVRAPTFPKEGRYAQFYPEQMTTGLFGRELSGKWLDKYSATARLSEICRLNALFRDDPRYCKEGDLFFRTWRNRIHSRIRRHLMNDPIGWFDMHATM